ncbi:ORF51 [Silurid herpesvirus 1]|nr:ORF51 [Silurid herpesvirus 1]
MALDPGYWFCIVMCTVYYAISLADFFTSPNLLGFLSVAMHSLSITYSIFLTLTVKNIDRVRRVIVQRANLHAIHGPNTDGGIDPFWRVIYLINMFLNGLGIIRVLVIGHATPLHVIFLCVNSAPGAGLFARIYFTTLRCMLPPKSYMKLSTSGDVITVRTAAGYDTVNWRW